MQTDYVETEQWYLIRNQPVPWVKALESVWEEKVGSFHQTQTINLHWLMLTAEQRETLTKQVPGAAQHGRQAGAGNCINIIPS